VTVDIRRLKTFLLVPGTKKVCPVGDLAKDAPCLPRRPDVTLELKNDHPARAVKKQEVDLWFAPVPTGIIDAVTRHDLPSSQK